MDTCRHCGRVVVRCEGAGHTASSVCRGWRHASTDPSLFHNIVCHNQETTAGFTVAEPTIEEI